MRRRGVSIAVLMAVASSLILAANASASFHLNKIREIHAGAAGPGTGNYVELQMYADGENFLSTHYLRTYDNGGNPVTTYQFTNNVGFGINQHTVLIADGPTANGVPADFDVPSLSLNVNSGGAVCYLADLSASGGLDCVGYGNGSLSAAFIMNPPSPIGTPALSATGFTAGSTLVRSISAGCATQLEGSDDTNDSSADFALGTSNPRNNQAMPTEKPCTTGAMTKKKKCKKHKKKKSGAYSAKKKCKKKKHHAVA
jgi:hypothetical protein